MRARRAGSLAAGLTAAAVAAAMLVTQPVASASSTRAAVGAPRAVAGDGGDGSDLTPVGPDLNGGKPLPLDASRMRAERRQNRTASPEAAAADAAVGETKTWLGYDDTSGLYPKDFTLRGLGQHIQVWVADDRAFPDGDCRNDLDLTAITDAQVSAFVQEFDTNIYPKESAAFSVPPSLDGSAAPLPGLLGLPADYYQVSADQADDIVVMVDNVRDANFYDPTSPDGQTYTAGFFYSTLDAYTDRNVMTIDAFDWLHRTGATPPDDSADPAYVACTQALAQTRAYGTPRPRLYEGTFAHEYQHLLESYEDPDEVSWVNEGISDYAQTLVGYVDTRIPPTEDTADSHIACFTGWLGENFGGSENSLTLWQDQGAPEILCDYGAAYSFMVYLESHYGPALLTALHREDLNGLPGLTAVLHRFGARRSAMDTIHDWATTMATDAVLDRGGRYHGRPAKRWLTSSQLSSSINVDTPQAYDTPGAPPNGADYVRLRGSTGTYLPARRLRSLDFRGATTLEPTPVEWVADPTPPDAVDSDTTCGAVPDGTGDPALYSGCGSNLDRAVVRSVDVPAAGGQLTFDAQWDTEEGWDFGFAQVSTDAGATWTSLATQDTTTEHDPGAVPGAVDNLPGFTGSSGSWHTESADLSAYAGQSVLLAFRYVTDGGVDEGGFWVRTIAVAGTPVPSDTVAGWQSATQVHPVAIPGWTVRLMAWDRRGNTWVRQLRLRGDAARLSPRQLRRAVGRSARLVAAQVMMDDPTETIATYGRYRLRVNGVVQPGG